MRNYVTLFDRNYLAKGLALYQSLQTQSSAPFTLYVMPLDEFTRKYLQYEIDKDVLPNMKLVRWSDIRADVFELWKSMEWRYFCFLMASEVTLALMKMLRVPISYVDSDVYFFDDPEYMYKEIGQREVAIVSHNFPEHDFARLSPNGLYNVSIMYFSNTGKAIDTLMWWNSACRAKCDAQSCGDQLYLNQFPEMLGDRLCILDGIFHGMGPWSAYTYGFDPGPKIGIKRLVSYHFHEFKQQGDSFYWTGYPVTKEQLEHVYLPYSQVIDYCQKHINKKAQEWYAD